jgi:hypothetical protein
VFVASRRRLDRWESRPVGLVLEVYRLGLVYSLG